MFKLLHEANQSTHRKLILCVTEWRGQRRLDARQHYLGEDGNWYPTKQGFVINDPEMAEAIGREIMKGAKLIGKRV